MTTAADRIRTEPLPAAIVAIGAICGGGIALLVARNSWVGWPLMVLSAVSAGVLKGRDRLRLLVAAAAVSLVGLTPISTNLSRGHILVMAPMLIVAAALPYAVLWKWNHDGLLTSYLKPDRRWSRGDVAYIVGIVALAYLIMPVYLRDTGSYHNWTVPSGAGGLLLLFLCTNALGIWDEMFFDFSILGIFRRFLPFWWANIAQSILWTSFLYQLGFRGWGPGAVAGFTLIQGYNFRRTGSLAYILTIHLLIDFVLFLALVHLYHPSWPSIFAT